MTELTSAQPGEVVPGKFTLIFDDALEEGDDPIRFEITFTWGGEYAASFVYDAWHDPAEPTFVAEINTDPVYGWASWINGQDVLIAFMHPLAAEEGWARVDNQAPGAELDDPDDALAQPETWLNLSKLIYAVTANKPLQGCDRQTF